MATLTIKNIPERLLQRVRALAAAEHRSTDGTVIQLLKEALAANPVHATNSVEARARAQVNAWRCLAGRWRSRRSAAHEIEQIYAARTRSRGVRF